MRLSIITINYNNLEGLKKTVRSVMDQTWRDFEWIIIDGGSTDGSRELIEEVAARPDSQVSYWCSEPDKGIYNAMNKGIAKAKGEYLNFMNSGDCFHDSEVLQELNNSGLDGDVIYGDSKTIFNDHIDCWTYPEQIDILYLEKYSLCHQSMFMKRALFANMIYDENLKILSDWKSTMMWFLDGKRFDHVPIYICNYDGYGMSSEQEKLSKTERTSILNEIVPDIYRPIVIAYRENRLQNELYDEYYPEIKIIKKYIINRRLYRRIFLFIVSFIIKIDKYLH